MEKQGHSEAPETAENLRAELAELVHLSLLQISEMTDMQDRLKLVSERLSKVTPTVQGDANPENHNPKPSD